MGKKTVTNLEFLAALIGRWEGKGEGFGQTSEVMNTFEWALDNKFVLSKSKSIGYNPEGKIVEIHEDLGMYSYDQERERIVLREFYTEGYVNTYVMDEGETSVEFSLTTEHTEHAGGLKARLRFRFNSEDTLEMVLDLARPGEELKPCQKISLKRTAA
jgi:hypothetical protein